MLLRRLLLPLLGETRTDELFELLVVHPDLTGDSARVTRALMAQALNMALFSDLLRRTPAAAAYAADRLNEKRRIVHDHGAVRSVVLDGMGSLPSGEAALLRVLTALGYRLNGVYPLDRLRMTGRSYAQQDLPQDIAQFFVSELHVDRFSPKFAAAALAVTASSRDPLTAEAKAALARFEAEGAVDERTATDALPSMAACFDRQHEIPTLADYEILLEESAEMAWIATEGNVFNHATDRVDDVEAVAAEQKARGRPMKDAVEVSASGRVRQTAFRAAQVARDFRGPGGEIIQRTVPGSFYEFITRLPMPETRGLDLAFDSANAQGIFKMTQAADDRG